MIKFRVPPLLLILVLAPLLSLAAARQLNAKQERPFAVIRGRAVCLDEAGRPVNELACDANSSSFALIADDGSLYRFLPTDPMAAVFADPRVRRRDLQVTARLGGKDQLEMIKAQSIQKGRLYDIYYFCETCNITAYTPGLCPCCRNELQFRETPVPEP